MSKKTLILRIVAIACACVLLLLLLTAVLLNRKNPTGDTQSTGNAGATEITDGTGEGIVPTTDAEGSSEFGEEPGLEVDSPLLEDPVEDPLEDDPYGDAPLRDPDATQSPIQTTKPTDTTKPTQPKPTQPKPTDPPPEPGEDTPDDTPLPTAPVIETPIEETKNDFSVDFDDLLNGAN